MKKIIFLFSLVCITEIALSQNTTQLYDSSFREVYKMLALHPGHRNSRGIIFDSVVRRWDKDIKIFIEGGSARSRREMMDKLKNTIAIISPALDNKIRISFVDDKASANYLVNIGTTGTSGWYLKWDGLNNIYSCQLLINTKTIFNGDQQLALLSHYFLQSLGDFVFTPNAPVVVSNMRLWRQDINDLDLRILKLHYSSDIRPGMAKKDLDQFFDEHDK